MNKMEFIAKEEKTEKEKLEKGNLATYVKFDYFNFDETKDAESYMLISMTAPEMKSTTERLPLNISACLDVSGSMADKVGKGTKIEYMKKSMKKMVQHLTEKDILGIVTFTGISMEVLAPVKMTSINKDKALKVIEGLQSLDSTNLSSGLFKSIEQLKINRNKDFINRVMLFTDGEANAGITEPNQLRPIMIEQLGTCSVSCFGFGETYNAELLGDISKEARGNLHHVTQSEHIPTAFAKELGGLLTVFAQNIEVNVKLENASLIENFNTEFKLLGDQSNHKDLTFNVNDIYSQETRNLLFKLKIEKGKEKVAVIKVTYLDLIKNKKVEAEKVAEVQFVKKDKADGIKDIDKDVAMQISIFEAAKAQTQAMQYANVGDYANARLVLNNAIGTVKSYNGTVDVGGIVSDMSSATTYYADSLSFTNNARSLNASKMSYSTGRSAEDGTHYSKSVRSKANILTKSLVDDFEKDEEKKA